MEKILISPAEAQKILGVGKAVIYRLVKEEDFPSFRLDNKFYINKELLQDWANKQCLEK